MKTILIIGSSGGLGTELISFFSSKNFKLALHYNNNKPSNVPENAKTYQADIGNESQVSELIAAVKEDFDTIDIVINNAGISKSEMSWKADKANWDETIAVNLTGPFLVSKYVIPLMRENGFGRIIFMSSIVAQTGFVGTTAYAASKAGLLGLTKSLSKEVANKNITVNAIALGYFNAGMINDVSADMQDALVQQIPVGKLGPPNELAQLINYLIDDSSSYLTGQTLNLNGGLHG
jgi:NAD(P)-dependent dehydrogenase (short-subunit alcohol dehydrogenase family)